MIHSVLPYFPTLNMTVKPSPIHKLYGISEACHTNIYCMRDDLTGFAMGGNKIRKLDYLLADALQKGADTLIGIGANQSNFCRMLAGAGAVNNLDVHLVLAGTKPEKPTGNLLVDHLFKATIHHIDTDQNDVLLQEAKKLENELIAKGKKVYNMPSGGSTKIGILGYVEAYQEILDHEKKYGVNFDTIIFASGSGGTQAGLIAGKTLTNEKHHIIGISVGREKEELQGIVGNLANQVTHLASKKVDEHDVIVDDGFIGECYGARTEEGEKAISIFANKEGILLDYVYTGKAVSGLLDYCEKSKFNRDQNILFIHTGGNIELFE